MNNIITTYVNKLKKEDIILFSKNNNLSVSEEEIDFVYNFIKNNYKTVLNDPKSFNLAQYKDKFSNENYIFLENLINKYISILK